MTIRTKKVLQQKEIVTDYETGEILSNKVKDVFELKQVKRAKHHFKFMPDVSEFFISLQGGTHHKVGYLLLDYQNINTGEIEVTKRVKEQIGKKLNVTVRMIEKSINELIKANVITPIDKSVYIMNPLFIYKGGTVDLENRVNEYDKLRGEYEHQHKQTTV